MVQGQIQKFQIEVAEEIASEHEPPPHQTIINIEKVCS